MLLSKNDFSSYLNIYSSESVQLTRTKLNGKIDQYGLTPIGYGSIVIPANYNTQFNWMHRKVCGNQILIFPKNGTLDTISYSGFDVFIVAIKNSLLDQLIENLGYNRSKIIFKGKEQYIGLSRLFSQLFCSIGENFLHQAMLYQNNKSAPKNLCLYLIKGLIMPLLKYIENSKYQLESSPQRKRDIAIKKAIEIINENKYKAQTISELCKYIKISERTLEYAFLEKYQISPSEFIKSTRLHKVKYELTNPKKHDLKISSIAGKYGFWHMGQFAADFKNQFGILPSELIKQKFN